MALEGDLKLFPLPDVLQVIAHQHKTGILTVQGDQDIIAVSFLQGKVVQADALNQTAEEGLGHVLASQGLVQPEQFATLVAEHQAGGERLVDLLLVRQLLDRARLLEALRVQTYQLLLQLLRWRDGEFKFYSGEEVSYEEGFLPIAIEELLIRALGDLGPEGGITGSVPQLNVVYLAEPSDKPLRVQGRDQGVATDPAVIWLTAEEVAVYEALDGRLTAGDLAPRTGLGDYQVLYALSRLLGLGLARSATEQRHAAEPTPRPAGAGETLLPSAEAAAPSLLPGATPRPSPRGRSRARPTGSGLGRALAATAAGLAVGLAVLFGWKPTAFILPFPWQAAERAQLEKHQRTAALQRLDRLLRTHYLLEGRYPEQVASLVSTRLLDRFDLFDPQGRRLEYTAVGAGYTVVPVGREGSISDLAAAEGTAGDFLLDPQFLAVDESARVVPLVLLD